MLERSFAAHLEVDRHVADSATTVAGGTMLRSRRFPHSWDLNQLVLSPGAGAAEVAAALDAVERELDGAGHRRVTIPAPAEPVRAPDGWRAEDLLVMLFRRAEAPPWPPEVESVSSAALRPARLEMWGLEGAGRDADELADMQVAFGTFPGAQSLAVARDGRHVAWAQMVNGCIDDVWVRPEMRGLGLGRAVTSAAVAAGGWFLWTDAGDPRPQGLYRSLGFAEAGRLVQMTRRVG